MKKDEYSNNPVVVSSGIQKFVFVASHGLRSSLTSIRWASKRLQRTACDTLSDEQQRLISQIHIHSSRLARTLSSMLLTTRIEEGMYKPHKTTIPVCTFLQRITRRLLQNEEMIEDHQWEIICDAGLSVRHDEHLLETIVSDVLAACLDAVEDEKHIAIEASLDELQLKIEVTATLEIALLSSSNANHATIAVEEDRLIGGTQGLLFSLASNLIQTMEGSFSIKEAPKGIYHITLLVPPLSASH